MCITPDEVETAELLNRNDQFTNESLDGLMYALYAGCRKSGSTVEQLKKGAPAETVNRHELRYQHEQEQQS